MKFPKVVRFFLDALLEYKKIFLIELLKKETYDEIDFNKMDIEMLGMILRGYAHDLDKDLKGLYGVPKQKHKRKKLSEAMHAWVKKGYAQDGPDFLWCKAVLKRYEKWIEEERT